MIHTLPSAREVRAADDGSWQMHRGDSLVMLRELPDSSIDALITDPPYSSGGAFRGDRMSATTLKYANTEQQELYDDFPGDNRDQRGWVVWTSIWLAECYRVLREGAAVALFTDWRMLPSTTDALQVGGFVWRGIIPWDKGEGTRPQLGRPRNQAEYIVWGSKGPMPLERDAPVMKGVLRHPVLSADKHHLVGKPTKLMVELVQLAERGSLILDPFAGSGTTLVGGKVRGFRSIGMEMHQGYYDRACGRLAGTLLEGDDQEAGGHPSIFDLMPATKTEEPAGPVMGAEA